MLIPCHIDVTSTPGDMRSLLAVYSHADAAGVVHYIGVCKLQDVLSAPDALNNSQWLGKFPGNEPIRLTVAMTTFDMREAEAERRRLVARLQPFCNIRGYNLATKYQQVRCIETGERFDNASVAAKAHNLTHSALYAHLQRKPGHKTVKGRTYEYVTPWTPETTR